MDFWDAVSLAAAVVATVTATATLVTAAAKCMPHWTYTVAKVSATVYAMYVHRAEEVKKLQWLFLFSAVKPYK